MELYIIKEGDTLQSIADKYQVSVQRLIIDNDLSLRTKPVIGNPLVIAYPKELYTVKQGDNLLDIAEKFNTTVIRLLINNPYLSDREYIFPGENIVISYDTEKGRIVTHGNTTPYIDEKTLRKTLPFLTYISVLNYTATADGDIISYYDDSKIIQLSKAYGVAPLMLLTTLTLQGEANLQAVYSILLNEDFQNKIIENILAIIREKGYYGVNISFENISTVNIKLYEKYFEKIASRLTEEGFLVFLTANPNLTLADSRVDFEKLDYSVFNRLAENIIFMSYEWASRDITPSPISSYYETDIFLKFILDYIPADKVIIGLATIGYDWELPYASRITDVKSLSFSRSVELAANVDATIQYDELSQTPYFRYTSGDNVEHIVWFINSRSINAIMDLVYKYNLEGISVWNIMLFNPQLWLIIASQFEIEKLYDVIVS